MKQKDKNLLLQDLCSRLPYGVKISVQSWDEREMEYTDRVDILYSVNGDEYIKTVNEDYDFCLEDIKPYLFPLSSMKGKHRAELLNLRIPIEDPFQDSLCEIDFYHRNHFDYKCLIEKGLAIDCTNLNIY